METTSQFVKGSKNLNVVSGGKGCQRGGAWGSFLGLGGFCRGQGT